MLSSYTGSFTTRDLSNWRWLTEGWGWMNEVGPVRRFLFYLKMFESGNLIWSIWNHFALEWSRKSWVMFLQALAPSGAWAQCLNVLLWPVPKQHCVTHARSPFDTKTSQPSNARPLSEEEDFTSLASQRCFGLSSVPLFRWCRLFRAVHGEWPCGVSLLRMILLAVYWRGKLTHSFQRIGGQAGRLGNQTKSIQCEMFGRKTVVLWECLSVSAFLMVPQDGAKPPGEEVCPQTELENTSWLQWDSGHPFRPFPFPLTDPHPSLAQLIMLRTADQPDHITSLSCLTDKPLNVAGTEMLAASEIAQTSLECVFFFFSWSFFS